MKKNRRQHNGRKEESYIKSFNCGKHGKVELWIGCKHLVNFPANIYFSSNKEALCIDCLDRIEELTVDELVPVCINCLRTIAIMHFEHAIQHGMSEEDILDMFTGLENLGPINS